jgi:excisionase family DNA binding protein
MRDINGMLPKDTKEDQREAMTVDECAKFLGVSRWTVYRMKAQREIPYTPFRGRTVRFYKPIIRKWLEKRSLDARD